MLNLSFSSELSNCRRVYLRDFELIADIGIHDFEVNAQQRIIVNVDLFIPLQEDISENDMIHEVVDYDFMRVKISEIVMKGHINLQETLCDDIARAMLTHPHVRAVRVSTEKPDVYVDCAAVGIEVFHMNR
jgi:7,8-dihydroneopterin aldolase/epimerase/oxygenase